MTLRFTGRVLVTAAFIALAAWLAVWLLLLAHGDLHIRLLWAAASLAPLALLAPVLLAGRKAGYAWAGFLSLGYFAEGVAVAMTGRSGAAFGAVEIFLSLLMFFAAGAALRGQRRGG